MRRMGIIVMCLAALVAVGAALAGSASATELLLSSASGTFKGVGGAAELIGVSKVVCSKTVSNATSTDAHLGQFTLLAEGCKIGSTACTGSKDTIAGNVTIKGEYHLNLGMKSSTDSNAGILILIEEIVLTCGILGTIRSRGSVVGLFFKKDGSRLTPGESLLGSLLVFKTVSKNTVQEDQEFLLALTTPENQLMTGLHLESSIFGGAFKESAIEASGEATEIVPAGLTLVTG
jgi:hypothetical protein